VRLIRTDGQGNVEWCRHTLGSSENSIETKLCIKQKSPGYETCGTRHQGEEVALEPNALFIKFSKDRLLQAPFVPCLILEETFIQELLQGLYSLAEARSLFRDLVTAAGDMSTTEGQQPIMDHEVMGRWRREIQGPMRTPSRAGRPPRKLVSAAEAADDATAPSPISPGFSEPSDPASPSLDLEYTFDDIDQRAWQQSLPDGLWDFILTLKTGLEKASRTALLAHQENADRWASAGRDLHALDVRLERTEETVGPHQPLIGFLAANVWDGLVQVSSRAKVATENAVRENRKLQQELVKLQTKNVSIAEEFSALSEKLSTLSVDLHGTQECARAALELVAELKEASAAGPRFRHEEVFDADKSERRQQALDQSRLSRDMVKLKAELGKLGKGSRAREGNNATSLLKGVDSQEEVYSWVLARFSKDNQEPELDDSFVDVSTNQGTRPASYGGFCDLYVFFATFEEDQARSTKGETLKEMDNLTKSGVKHPSEAVVLYSFKRPVPATFGHGHALGGSYFAALKTVQDWDASFSTDVMPKPGLKQILLERCEGVERHIKSIIEEVYGRHGYEEVAHLARSMLTDSVKLLKVLVEYLSELYRELTERSGFLPSEAWGLVTQCGRSVFMQLTKMRETLGIIDPKDSAYRNTARVLFAMLKTHDEMAKFVLAEIKNHPVISSEYVKFLASHAPNAAVRKLETKLAAVETIAKSAQAEAKKAMSKK
jgi:hypothetical protein